MEATRAGLPALSCAQQCRAMAFAQLTWPATLRHIEAKPHMLRGFAAGAIDVMGRG